MHPEQQDFVASVRRMNPQFFKNCRVLEVGSRTINGTIRTLFKGCDYTGIDCNDGPDVDFISLAHEYETNGKFDTIVSCEAFEHDPFLNESIHNCMMMLRPGGLFVATMAGPKRQEHGTTKTEPKALSAYRLPHGPDPEFYENVSAEKLRGLLERWLNPLEVYERMEIDTYAWGLRNDA